MVGRAEMLEEGSEVYHGVNVAAHGVDSLEEELVSVARPVGFLLNHQISFSARE